VINSGKPVIRAGWIAAILTLLVYAGSLSCGFINLDDPYYITGNPLIKSIDFDSLRRIFTESHLGAWLPLTYLSFALDHAVWGLNPAGYHLTNTLLHAANAVLVVLLADRLCRERFAAAATAAHPNWLYPGMLILAGLLFSLHPLRVESVVWASARKDVLNGFFTLAAILAYVSHVRRKEAGEGAGCRGPYLLSVMFFVFSLLAKQVSVTLPVVLLLLDWYPLKRFSQGRGVPLLMEKVPYFIISGAITAATVFFAASQSMLVSMQEMPLLARLVVSGNAIFEYCRFSLFPVGISPYFVLPKPVPYGYFVKSAVVAVMTVAFVRSIPRRPGAAVTWLVFVVLLSPTLSLVHSGDDIAMAARYTYLPSIAPAIALSMALMLLVGRLRENGRAPLSAALLACAASLLVAGSMVTLRLVPVWKDTGSFWSRVIEIEPAGRAYADRGVFYLINDRSADAVADFNTAIGIAAGSGMKTVYNLYAFRGVAMSDTGRFAEAVADFDRAIELHAHPTYFHLRATALMALGKTAEAAEDFRRAGPNPPPIDWF